MTMPDFSEDLYKPPVQKDPTNELPDFTDDLAPKSKSLFEELPPQLRGILGALGGAADAGTDLAAMYMGPTEQSIIGAFSPSLVTDIKKRRERIVEQRGAAIEGIKSMGREFADHPLDATASGAVSMVKAFLYQPIVDVFKMSGYDPKFETLLLPPGHPDRYKRLQKLSDEEIELASKATTANIVSYVIGTKAHSATMDALGGLKPYLGGKGLAKLRKAKGEEEMMAILNGTLNDKDKLFDLAINSGHMNSMPWAQTQLAGLVGGAAGGVAYGYTGSPEDEQISAAITMGIIAMPLGASFSAMGHAYTKIKGRMPSATLAENTRGLAFRMASLREFAEIEGRVPLEVLHNIDNLQQVKPIQAAYARKGLEYNLVDVDKKTNEPLFLGKNSFVVPGVDAVTIPEVLKQLEPHPDKAPSQAIIHARGDGFHDILIAPMDLAPPAVKFFEKTGFLEGQQVTYGGNERWVIRDATVPAGKKKYELTLRNMVTEEHISGVGLEDVIRPSNKYIGELVQYGADHIKMPDLMDPARGLSTGPNSSAKQFLEGASQQQYHGFLETSFDKFSNYLLQLDSKGNVSHLEKGIDAPTNIPDKIELHNGINEITRPGPKGIVDGITIYVTDDGISGFLGWRESPRPSGGRPIRRVDEAWNWLGAPENIRKETSKAMDDYRVKKELFASNSSVSEGARKSQFRRLNANWQGRKYTAFGTYTADAFWQDTMTSFLDHIGFVNGEVNISPREVVERLGLRQVSGRAKDASPHKPMFPTGIGETVNTVHRSREGITSLERPAGVLFKTKEPPVDLATGRKEMPDIVNEARARELLAAETVAGHVPETSTRPKSADPLTIHESLSFDEILESFLSDMPVKGEAKALFKYKIEFELGRILKGDHNLLDKYIDKRTAITWRQRIDAIDKATSLKERLISEADPDVQQHLYQEIKKVLEMDEHDMPQEVEFKLAENKKTKAVLEARINQLENPVLREFSPDEQVKLEELYKKAQDSRKTDAKNLMQVAHANGFYIERSMGGVIEIKDMRTGRKIPGVAFSNEPSATQWIKDTGGVKSMEIDGGSGNNMIPPESIGGGLIPNPGQAPKAHEIPYEFRPDGWFGKITSLFDVNHPRLTGKRAYFVGLDGKVGTKFYADMVHPVQGAKMISQAKKEPYRAEVKAIEDALVKAGVPREQWSRIIDYRSKMSVEDIDAHVFGDSVPRASEIEMSQRLANDNIDVKEVYEYNRNLAELQEQHRMSVAKIDPDALDAQQKVEQLKATYDTQLKTIAENMDPAHMKAAEMFRFAKKQGRDVFRLDVATRRARAIMNKEQSRSGFAEAEKMTKAEIQAAEALDSLYARVNNEAGITGNFDDYLAHHLVEGEGVDFSISLRDSKLTFAQHKETATLASKFADTGEMGGGNRDPILDAVNHVNKLMDHTYFDNTWNDARSAAIEHLKKLPKEAREYASRVVGEYLYGMKGVPNAHDQYSKAMVKNYYEDIGLLEKGKEPTTQQSQMIGDMSDILLSASSAALLGGRPAQGIRDLHGFMRNYYTKFGAARTANGFRLAFERNPATGRLPIYELAEQGKVPGLSILQFLSEAEVGELHTGGGSHLLRDAVFKAAKIGITTSGQHNIYALAHAVAYLETNQFTGRVLLDLGRDKITKKVAYKKLKIDTYDVPVAEGFDRLVMEGKFNEATEYLAQATGTETAFIYGLQNHPYGWGSKQGRIMGQFGQWPVWNRDFLARVASRGSAQQRAAAMARFAMSESMLWAAGAATGLNVMSWYGIPGILFTGSPLMGLATKVSELSGMRGEQRQKQALAVHGGKIPILSQFIPGASAFADYYQAYQLGQNRYGPVPVIGKALGFSVDKSQRSWLDDLTEQYPRVSGR